jgi:uncharacterized membrane protein
MTQKTFQMWKIVIVIGIAMITSISIVRHDAIIPLSALIIGSLLLIQLRRSVKGVLSDERDNQIAGKSALLAMRIFSWITVVMMLFFFAKRGTNPSFEPIAYTLSYSTCLLIMLYAVIAKFHLQPVKANARFWFSLSVGIVAVLLFLLIGARLFSGEDDWICSNGQWIQHGHPSFPAPQEPCK